MATTLLIVRDEALLYALGKSDVLPAGEPSLIILDRREGERRQNDLHAAAERRRRERRVNQDAQAQLRHIGYTVIRGKP